MPQGIFYLSEYSLYRFVLRKIKYEVPELSSLLVLAQAHPCISRYCRTGQSTGSVPLGQGGEIIKRRRFTHDAAMVPDRPRHGVGDGSNLVCGRAHSGSTWW